VRINPILDVSGARFPRDMTSVVPAFALASKFANHADRPRQRVASSAGFVYIRCPVTATERVGRYQLLEPIGVGPSGSVSRAKVFGVAGFERQFAVKRFHAELTATASMAQALSAAARAYGGLEHPRIARMSEFGVAQGTTFTAVEYVAGLDSLRLIAEARLANSTLAAGGALALVSQAARAVGYAHGRGLTHLGLSPTNVIVTGDGDVKITDFGILSATLPQRPIDVIRLAHRIQYLAPEQLANEATSAATDVFALGVLAYELVTGQRTFRGETPQQIAQSVMSGPPAEPPLPRPIVRVLQRCLARSPFERFPDARALADALDAALRVAPVPGTRKDIGSQVKQTLERLAELHSGELSGMVALNVGTANVMRGPVAPVVGLGLRDSQQEGEFSTSEFVRPDTPVAGPAPLVGPSRPSAPPNRARSEPPAGNTLPDLPKQPFVTVAGLAPPPIPVPPGLAPPPIPPPPSIHPPNTLLGLGNAQKPPPIPPIKPIVMGAVPPPKPVVRQQTPPPIPSTQPPPAPPTPAPIDRPSESPVNPLRMMDALPSAAPVPTLSPRPLSQLLPKSPPGPATPKPPADAPERPPRPATDPASLEDRPTTALDRPQTPPPAELRLSGSSEPEIEISGASPHDEETVPGDVPMIPRATDAMSPLLVEKLSEATTKPTVEIEPLVAEASQAEEAIKEFREEDQITVGPPRSETPARGVEQVPAHEPPREQAYVPQPASNPMPVYSPPSAPLDHVNPYSAPPPQPAPYNPQRAAELPSVRAEQPRKRWPWIVVGVVGALGIGGGVYFAIDNHGGNDDTGSGSNVVADHKDAAVAADAEQVAIANIDAEVAMDASASASDAGVLDAAAIASAIDAAAPADAQIVAPAIDAGGPVAPSGELAIASTPAGARVFFDGADVGVTPLKLPGTTDKHTVALLLAAHELYVAKVDGHGSFAIPLKEITPSGGPAGIKVVKCAKDRYYVFVDGKPTGQTCPTERIGVELGAHVVEVYDVVSETRRKWEITITDTRLSYRVKID
jgi:serine/threonine-protein kinase